VDVTAALNETPKSAMMLKVVADPFADVEI
jgi:hypothetical protein